jgi:hypothetical protein
MLEEEVNLMSQPEQPDVANEMNAILVNYLPEVKLGELQVFQNMAILPLHTSLNSGPDYVLLKEALGEKFITISEVDQSGSVPELKVANTSPHLILLLDGEELAGAKQNRVLNTSICLGGNTQTVIPVTCTEQGRWRYRSATFSDSDVIMSHRSRALKARTVTDSLHREQDYSSDQGRIWRGIRSLHREAGTTSTTLAMRDVYTAKIQDLEAHLAAFECVSHQRGSLVFVNGQPVGLDMVSREEAYATLHPKLVKSYGLDALLQTKETFDAPSVAKARTFLQEAQACRESQFASVGEGYDYRFEGPTIVGSALVFQESVIHLALFRMDKTEGSETMAGYRQRKGFRLGDQ